MAGEFIERNIPPRKDCGEIHADWGPSNSYIIIFWKGNANEEKIILRMHVHPYGIINSFRLMVFK